MSPHELGDAREVLEIAKPPTATAFADALATVVTA
jgi:hypothetical protein